MESMPKLVAVINGHLFSWGVAGPCVMGDQEAISNISHDEILVGCSQLLIAEIIYTIILNLQSSIKNTKNMT
jgi:hypothetical protein